MRLVLCECQGLNGQLEGKCGEGVEGVEVAQSQVSVLVPAQHVVVGGDETGYAVARGFAHLLCAMCRSSLRVRFPYQVSAVQGEHVQGVACLVMAGEYEVALRSTCSTC